MPIDDHGARDECDRGGEAPCWAHLLDEDGALDPTAPETDTAPREAGTEATSSS